MRGDPVGGRGQRGAFRYGGKQGKKHIPATQAVFLNEGEVSRQVQPTVCGGGGFFNHFRDEPEGLVGVTGSGTWPVGAGWGPLGSEGASLGRRGLGVERSTVWVAGALGVSGVGLPSSPTSMASSLSEEASDSSSSEGGEASG